MLIDITCGLSLRAQMNSLKSSKYLHLQYNEFVSELIFINMHFIFNKILKPMKYCCIVR